MMPRAAGILLGALALQAGTTVTAVTVVEEHTFLGRLSLRRLGTRQAGNALASAQEEAAQDMQRIHAEALEAMGLQVERKVARGSPAPEIIRVGHEIGADLIVVGAKGAGSSARFPLGTVAQKIVKYSQTNVLLVRERPKRLRRVMLATDGSEHSEETARFLIGLSLPRTSKVVLVTALESHVVALVRGPTLDAEVNRQIIAELQAIEEEAARSLIAKTRELFEGKGYRTESLVLKGRPAEEILNAARTAVPDLIAVGAKGLGGVEAFLLGGVSQRIARYSPFSVLIVRGPKC